MLAWPWNTTYVEWLFVLPDYTPMAPTQVREFFHRDGWVYERRWAAGCKLVYKDVTEPAKATSW